MRDDVESDAKAIESFSRLDWTKPGRHAKKVIGNDRAGREMLLEVVKPGDQVLDLGVGNGKEMLHLLDKIGPLFIMGVDGSFEMCMSAYPNLRKATESTGSDFRIVLADIDNRHLPFHNNSFSVVNLSQVLQHVKDMIHAFIESVRVSQKYVIISVPGPIYHLGMRNITRLTPEQMAILCHRAEIELNVRVSMRAYRIDNVTRIFDSWGDAILYQRAIGELQKSDKYSKTSEEIAETLGKFIKVNSNKGELVRLDEQYLTVCVMKETEEKHQDGRSLSCVHHPSKSLSQRTTEIGSFLYCEDCERDGRILPQYLQAAYNPVIKPTEAGFVLSKDDFGVICTISDFRVDPLREQMMRENTNVE